MASADIRTEFLEYFEIAASERNLSLLAAACNYWKLGEGDLRECMRNAKRYHRTDLRPIRKILGLYIYEWMIPFAEDWDKRIYFNVPGTVTWMYWMRELPEFRTYAGSPDFISMTVLYGLFGKPEKMDTGNCRHCPVNMMRADLIKDSDYPAADAQISFGFTCDEAPKQDELALAEVPERKKLQYTVANPSRGEDETEFIRENLQKVTDSLAEEFGLGTLSEQQRHRYCDYKIARFKLATRVYQIIDYVRTCGRFVISNNDIVFIESLLITSFYCGMDEITSTLIDLIREMKSADGKPVRYRFCVYYTPICNPEYGEIMEQNGIALLDQTSFGNKAIYTDKTDPCSDAALEGMGMVIAGTAVKEGNKVADIIERKNFDGFVSGMFAFDRWLGTKQHTIKCIVEERTDAEVFIFDSDFWNQEAFSAEKMRAAVETLACLLEDKKNER